MISPFASYIVFGIMNIGYNRLYSLSTYVGVMLIIIYRNKNNPIIFPKYLGFYLLFLLYEYYSTFFILNREFKMMYLVSNPTIATFNLLFIVENLSINKKYYNYLFNLSKKILIIALLVIIIQQTYDSSFFVEPIAASLFTKGSVNEASLFSIYSWTSALGTGLSFVPILYFVIEDLDRKNKTKKVWLWLLFGMVFALLTKARWIMINTLMSFLLLIITKKGKFKLILKYLTILPIILMISFFTLNSIGVDVDGIVEERILESGTKDIRKKSAGTRLLAFTAFNKFFWKKPILGQGNFKYGMGGTGKKQDYELEKFLAGRSSQLHVGYLSVLYMFGLVGGLFFVLFIFFFLKKMYLGAKMTGIWAPFLGILSFAIANLTLVTFNLMELGLIFAVLSNKYFVKQYQNTKRIKEYV